MDPLSLYTLMTAAGDKANASMMKAIVTEMQKGQMLRSVLLFGMVVFSLMLVYILKDSKSQAKQLRDQLAKIEQGIITREKDQFANDKQLIIGTTQVITAFNAKFPQLMDFIDSNVTNTKRIIPRLDELVKKVDEMREILILIKEHVK